MNKYKSIVFCGILENRDNNIIKISKLTNRGVEDITNEVIKESDILNLLNQYDSVRAQLKYTNKMLSKLN
jgi:hypothetical protein